VAGNGESKLRGFERVEVAQGQLRLEPGMLLCVMARDERTLFAVVVDGLSRAELERIRDAAVTAVNVALQKARA
jgi:hypothetical protein